MTGRGWTTSIAVLSFGCRLYGAQLVLPDTASAPGSTIIVSVALSSEGTSISGVQFDISWDDRALAVTLFPGNGLQSSAKELYTAGIHSKVRPYGIASQHRLTDQRCLIVGLNQTAIADGEIVQLSVLVKPTAASEIYNVTISNAIGTTPDGQAIPITGVTAKVSVQIQAGAIPLQSGSMAFALEPLHRWPPLISKAMAFGPPSRQTGRRPQLS